MKLQVYVPDPLNEQASVLVDAQTDIKTTIKQATLSGAPASVVRERVQKIINAALARIRSPTLKGDARISLMRFADRAYGRFAGAVGIIPPELLPAVVVLMRGITEREVSGEYYVPKTLQEQKAAQQITYREYGKGIPLREFTKTYMERVQTALDGLSREEARDPNDLTGKNSLRNLAEMQVRYERHQDEIAELKESGARLVVCSVHADCSGRCAPWQGRVYSLDGTSGRTEDGRNFQPLENATEGPDVERTKRGIPNGLLGFNCRHKLFEYKPRMVIPTVSEAEQKREYAITRRQREMERSVLEAREKALAAKNANISEHREWRKIAQERYAAYKKFSNDNGRAYYPDRVKIL